MARSPPLRPVLLGTVIVAVLGLGGWAANNLIFGGRVHTPAGLPHTLVVQRGVQEAEIALVVEGLRLADEAFQQLLGERVPVPVVVRLARRTPCIAFERRTTGTAVADAESICIDTTKPTWRYAAREEPTLALSIVAHEHLHNLQGQLGCLPGPDEHLYAWWVEGSATYMGWRALEHAARVTQTDIERELRDWGGFSPGLNPLESYERAISGDPTYALAARAVAQLVARAGAPALVDFCARVGAGTTWRAAFRSSFGVGVSAFYGAFEAERNAARKP